MYTSFLGFGVVVALLVGEGLAIDGQWTQCGGKREGIPWGPENTCNNAGGYYCVEVNEWYWQCRNDQGKGANNTYNQPASGASQVQPAAQFLAQPPASSSSTPAAASSPAALFTNPNDKSFLQTGSKIETADGDYECDDDDSQPAASSPAASSTPPASTPTTPASGSPGVQPAANNQGRPGARLAVAGNGNGIDQFAQGPFNGGSTSGISSSESGVATTSRYGISATSLTACGCAGFWMAPGDVTVMGAAMNEAQYGDPSKCSDKCGTCYELTSTGSSPNGAANQPKGTIVVMIVDACPVNGNSQWCAAPNAFGKSVHFDIAVPENSDHGPNHWDNPVVNYRKLDKCPGQAASSMTQKRQAGGIHDNYKNCRCAKEGKGAL